MLKVDHKIVIAYTTTNVIGVTTVFVKYPSVKSSASKIIFSFLTYTDE